MTEERRILNVLGQVDEKYIEEAAPITGTIHTSRHRFTVILVAAILALLLMGAGIIAVIYGDSIQNWFGHYWEAITGQTLSDGQTAVIEHLSQEIDISQTVGDVTVTVDSATVGDDTFFLLLRVDGMDFSKKYSYGFADVAMEVRPDPTKSSDGIGAYGFQYHGLDGDGAVLLLMDYGYSNSNGFVADSSPLEVTLKLQNLIQSPHTDRERPLVEGQWDFVFSLDRSIAPKSIRLPDTEIMVMDLDIQEEVPVTITNIELTSTGLRFQYDYADGTLSIEAHISVVLENGLTIRDGGGVGTPLANGNILNCSHQWQVPINLDEVVAIQIGETQIDVP